MSHVLTETPTKGSALTVPDPSDGATSSSVEGPFQACANRIAWCEGAIDSSGGKHPLKVVVSEAAMTALASPASGDQCVFPTVGVFTFVTGSTATPVAGVIVTHAAGRWFRSDWEMLADVGGTPLIATLVGGKLPTSRHTNGIVRTSETEYTGTWGSVIPSASSAAAAWTDVPVDHLEASLKVGDILEIEVVLYLSASAIAPAYAYARIKCVDDNLGSTTGPLTTTYAQTEQRMDGNTATQRTIRKRHVVTAQGQCQIKLQVNANGSDAARILYPTRFNVTVIRP